MMLPLRLSLTIAAAWALHAAPHRYRLHANAAIHIHSIAPGSGGWLWLAAADGLYRFDGQHFRKEAGYPFAAARYVAVGGDGAVWAGGEQGLARFRNGHFQTIAKDLVRGLAVEGNRAIFATDRLWQADGDGRVTLRLDTAMPRGFAVAGTGAFYYICGLGLTVCMADPGQREATLVRQLPALCDQAVPDGQGRLWMANVREAVLYEGIRAVLSYPRRHAQSDGWRSGMLVQGRQGQLWIVADTVRGVSPPVVFEHPASDATYPPTALHEGPDGRVWVARRGLGLVEWVRDTDWQRWSSGGHFDSKDVTQVIRAKAGMIAATHGNLWRRDPTADTWRPLAGGTRRYYSILSLPQGGFLAATGDLGLVRLDERGRVMETVPNPMKGADWFREVARDGAGRIWVGSKAALFKLDSGPGAFRLLRQTLPMQNAKAEVQAVDIEVEPGGRPCAGYSEGIACLDPDGQWRQLRTDRPVGPVRSFAMAGDDIWVARRRRGPFSRMRRNAADGRWTVTEMRAEDGYGPGDTHFLKRDSRGWIWRGSTDGVHVSDGRRTAPDDWLHLHPGNGMPVRSTDIYGFFEDAEGSVWIAGAEGVARVRPEARWFQAPMSTPAVSWVGMNGREMLRVEVGSLEAPPFRDRPFRYRVAPDDGEAWRPSGDGAIALPALAAGSRVLEVALAGDGRPPVLSHPFQAAPAMPGWHWGWMLAAPALLGAALLRWARRTETFERAHYFLSKAVFFWRTRRPLEDGNEAAAKTGVPDGPYRIVREVARGGFSAVYEGLDPESGERVAVKVLRANPERAGWVRERFLAEVSALQAIRHPGVVGVREWWITPSGEPSLAMPFLEGPSLREALASGPLTRRRAARVATQIASALSAIHAKGLVHRDVKPDNVILTRAEEGGEEQAVLIDFGGAALRAAERGLALTSVVAGSPHYMPPELLTGHYSASSDVYSLGAVFFEMLSGKRLSDLRSASSGGALEREIAEVLSAEMGAVTAGQVAAALRAALQPDPERRPADVGAWVAEIVQNLGPEA